MRVEIYSKPDCGLCEEAKRALRAVQQRVPFELVEVNILGTAFCGIAALRQMAFQK